ncbi:MAG TPA: MFS transporter [Anaerolineae bacterium]|nr:MFS transporter [Anaerolineae bacterium]
MAHVVRTLRDSFTPLRLPNLRAYLTGQAISLLGTWMQVTAQGWLVWELSKSEVALGIVSMLGSLPLLLFGLWAGVWADRLDRRKILIGTQAAAMILAFILAALVWTHTVQLWHVYVLSFLLGCVTALDFPAQQAFLGDLSGMTNVRKAIVLNAMIFQIGRMIGPALAGFVVGAIGAAAAFFLNGISFIAVIISLLIVRSHQVRLPYGGDQLRAVLDGLRFIKNEPRIQELIMFATLVTFFGISLLNFFPALAADVLHGDAQTLGILLASSGAGAFLGATVVAPLAQTPRLIGRTLGVAVIWVGLWWSAVSLSQVLPLTMLCIFLVSIAMPTIMTTVNSLLQVMAPPKMRGRLLSAYIIVSFGIQPIAALFIGFFASRFGIASAILIDGGAIISGALALLIFRPALRSWSALYPTEQPTGTDNISIEVA